MIVSIQESSKHFKAPKELEPYLHLETDTKGKIGITILDSKLLEDEYTLAFMRLVKEAAGSTGQRNESLQPISGCFKIQGFTWSLIHLQSYCIKIGLAVTT